MYYLCAFKNLQNHLNQSIQRAKQNYVNKIVQRLGDLNTSSKCSWSLLKTLLNRKKILCIPPLPHGDKYIVDFSRRVGLSNLFLLTNVLRFRTEMSYLLNYHYGQIAHYLLVILQKMTYFE